MANRSTVKSNIATINVPSVSNSDLNLMLQNELADNLTFLEDEVKTQSSVVSSITVNFDGFDRIELTRTGGSISITIAGMADGARKYLKIIKSVNRVAAFVNAVNLTPISAEVGVPTEVVYEIIRKGSDIFVIPLVTFVSQGTTTKFGVYKKATDIYNSSDSFNVITPNLLDDRKALETNGGMLEMSTYSNLENGDDYGSSGFPIASRPDHVKALGLSQIDYAILTDSQYQGSSSIRGCWESATATEANNPTIQTRVLTPYSVFTVPSESSVSTASGWTGSIFYYWDNTGLMHVNVRGISNGNNIGVNNLSTIGIIPLPSNRQYLRIGTKYVPTVSAPGASFVTHMVNISQQSSNLVITFVATPHGYTAGELISFSAIIR